MSLQEEDVKEALEFATRLGGSGFSVFEQMLMDWAYQSHPEWRGNILFQRMHPNLPANSTLLVSGLNLAPWAAALFFEDDAIRKGDSKTRDMARGVREFTEGGVLYTVPRCLRITAVNSISSSIKPSAPAGAPGQNPPQTKAIVYKL